VATAEPAAYTDYYAFTTTTTTTTTITTTTAAAAASSDSATAPNSTGFVCSVRLQRFQLRGQCC